MEFIYPFFISFLMVFVSELGDKTQLLVLSFSGKDKTFKILLGVAIGSFFSHGLAILFGSSLALFENQILHHTIELITYSSFIIMGILSLLPKKEKLVMDNSKKENLLYSKWGCSSVGRAPALQAGGHGFDSHHLHQRQAAAAGNDEWE